MTQRRRSSADRDFRESILARARSYALANGLDPQRVQQRIAFERLLARLAGADGWVLKGGFALEMRYGWRNRPTKDLDLQSESPPDVSLDQLKALSGDLQTGDHFTFELLESTRELQGAPGAGIRVRVVARVAGTIFARFHVDLVAGDVVTQHPNEWQGMDTFVVSGLQPIRIPIYPIAQHMAEKLHAYTLPREHQNTRAKDLVDMVIIIAEETIRGDDILASVRATFDRRGTHDVPMSLPEPPESWGAAYAAMMSDARRTEAVDLQEGYRMIVRFWSPVLNRTAQRATWTPLLGAWDA
jgi:predicted nucleotidyltransferase component of viral defense system